MNYFHTAWVEGLFKLISVTSCLVDVICASNCPPIFITTRPMQNCWPECDEWHYCRNGVCNICSPCPDPYTMAAQGETELVIIAECLYKGSCPNSCDPNPFVPKGNVTLCNCVGVTPPPPTVAPTIACKVGCEHGGCVQSGECNCDDGWSGALCDECVPEPDCQHGHCNETERCICSLDWDGVNCDQDVSYCGMNQPCLNNGQCENDGSGGYTCICSEGFTGANCQNETSLHRCQRFCPVNGVCRETDSTGNYECHCQDGYVLVGDNCTQLSARSSSGIPVSISLSIASALALFVVVAAGIVFFRKKIWCHTKPDVIPGSSSNYGVPLITGAIDYRLEGSTVFLTIKPSWTPCWLKTCKCLMEAPLHINEDSGTEVSVPNLREGSRYNFEICKCNMTPRDVEDSDCSVAECEVSVEISASESGEDCTETIGKAMHDHETMKALNKLLEADRRLRERVAGFFEMSTDNRKSFIDGQTPTSRHIDILQEILVSYDLVDKPIDELLSHLAEESSDKTGDFVERLAKFHPMCRSCSRIWHQTHGGTSVWSHAACNGVAIDV